MQEQAQELIERLKLGETNAAHVEAVRQLVRRLKMDWDADTVITACTEFACLPDVAADLPIVDSSRELASYVVRLAFA